MNLWTVLWIGWGALFAAIEGVALINDTRGDTLSEHLRAWFRTDTRPGRTVWLITSGAFIGWFLLHIALEGFA